MRLTTLRHAVSGFFVLLLACYALSVQAYDVEANTSGNKVYKLLLNDNPGAVYHSISVGDSAPAFVNSITATIVPAAVLGGSSDLAVLTFDVGSAAVGASGDLVATVSGLAAGTPIEVMFDVPLEVVASAPTAQGFVGTGEPAPDPGGEDSDGDGVQDSLEIAYGSNPNSASSIPGQVDTDGDGVEDGSDPAPNDPCDPDPLSSACAAEVQVIEENVPVLGPAGYLLLATLLSALGATQTRRSSKGGAA